jgi:hypothetical protein
MDIDVHLELFVMAFGPETTHPAVMETLLCLNNALLGRQIR